MLLPRVPRALEAAAHYFRIRALPSAPDVGLSGRQRADRVMGVYCLAIYLSVDRLRTERLYCRWTLAGTCDGQWTVDRRSSRARSFASFRFAP